jgi:hypothetical protein
MVGTALRSRGAGAAASRWTLAACAVAVIALVAHGLAISFLNDDAFISYRYAENWAAGRGLVFNEGERVEGYTNFLWTVLIGCLLRAGVDPLLASRVLGGLAAAAAIVVTARLGAAIGGPRGGRLAPLLLAASTPFAYWTFAGLEGPLFAFLLVLAFERDAAGAGVGSAPANRRGGALLGVVVALLALTRPEGALVFAFFLAARAARERDQGWTRALRGQLGFAAAFLAVFVPYFAWRTLYYGELLPNTFHVRQGRTLAENLGLYRNGVAYVLAFVRDGGGIAIVAPLLLLVSRGGSRVTGGLLAFCAVWIAYLVAVGGDAKILYRFFVPILPLLFLLVERTACVLHALLAERARSLARARTLRAVAATLVATLLLVSAAPSFAPPEKYRIDRTFFAMLAEGGKWLARYAPADATVACFAVGALPYYARLRTYDLLGVTDEHIARGSLRAGEMTGHGKTDWPYILAKRPTFIFPMESPDLSAAGYQFAPISVNVGGEVLTLRAWRRIGS